MRTFSTSRADDAAFLALADITGVVQDYENTRIVGGQMVALLMLAFPMTGVEARRTADADAAIMPVLASSGDVHQRLTSQGYEALRGNHYVREGREIDLLVPATASTFEASEHGGRMFDAAPGLRLALNAAPITLEVDVTLLDESELRFSVRVTSVEIALVLKAYALQSRLAPKDVVDLFNLLAIAEAYAPDDIGGWSLRTGPLRAARLDAARILHWLADRAETSEVVRSADVDPTLLTVYVRRHVATE